MITLALCFRNIEGIYVPILIAVASLVCTMGVMPLAGLKQNMISSLTPIFVMASAVADAIHVLNRYYRNMSQDGLSKQQAIQAAITKLFKPILLTSVTTICGFLSLAYTEVIFIREFGIMVAVGIFFALIFSIVMIPALLMLNKRSRTSNKKSLLVRGIRLCLNSCNTAWQNSPKVIVGVMTLLFMVSAFYAINVKVDYETISFYPEESKLRVDDRAFKEKLDGIIPLTIKFEGTEEEALFRKDVVDYIDQVEDVLNQHADVGFLVSTNSYLRRMLQVLSDGDRDQLPDDLSENMTAQLFLLYDNSSGAEIRDVADQEYRDGRIIALITTDRASVVRDVVDQALSVPAPGGINVSIAGHASIVLAATDEIIYGQFNSIIITGFVVLVIMTLLFRQFSLALIAVTPLVLTILVNFGIMGYLKLDLNIATVIIAALVFGIGIDYAIHFIEAAKLNVKQGLDKNASLVLAMKSTAEPILINSLTLAAGFLVMTISDLKPLFYLGNLISATMIISALLTIIILPTLLSLLPINLADKSQDA
jgi:predicted RND superfamily exporter protein